jgi:hypothetical protein
MVRFLGVLSIFLGLSLGGCLSYAAQAGGASADTTLSHARVAHDDGVWTVDYRFDRDAPAWVFPLSALTSKTQAAWRLEQWEVETPGVMLERQGVRDLLRATTGSVPRQVRIRFRPVQASLEREYDPALIFTSGAVALYSEQFNLVPAMSVDEIGQGASIVGEGVPATEISYHDAAGDVLFRGRREATPTASDARTYVLFGPAVITEGRNIATLADPQLPLWLQTELLTFSPEVMELYAARLGPKIEPDRPMVMVNWAGPTLRKVEMSGGVRPGLILMTFEGEGVLDREPRTLARARWFIAHEAAHFWLGSSGVRYEGPASAWITEGGADLMAVRALAHLDPNYDATGFLQSAFDDCVGYAGEPLSTASERGEGEAHYACGAVLGLVAEAAVRKRGGQDVFDFLHPLLLANQEDRLLTREEWLAELGRVAGGKGLEPDIDRLLDHGLADPMATFAGLFDQVGVAYERGADGRVHLLPL